MKQKGSSFSKNNLKVERERVIMVVVVMGKVYEAKGQLF